MPPKHSRDLWSRAGNGMIRGKFVGNRPLIKVAVSGGESIQTPSVILDTGFTGDLLVNTELARELGLTAQAVTSVEIANNQVLQLPAAYAHVAMEGTLHAVEILIAEGFPLAGIGLLTKFGYRAIIDCKTRTIELAIAA